MNKIVSEKEATFRFVDKWDGIVPKEEILRALTETKTVNVLCIGALKTVKEYDKLLRVISTYHRYIGSDVVVRVIGKSECDQKDRVLSSVSKSFDYSVISSIEYIEDDVDELLLSYLLGSDLLVCFSIDDDMRSIIESALHFGLPIVSDKDNYLTGDCSKFILYLDNEKEFVSAIKYVTCNREKILRLSMMECRHFEKDTMKENGDFPRFSKIEHNWEGAI